jgi:FkbM family methyltransferase
MVAGRDAGGFVMGNAGERGAVLLDNPPLRVKRCRHGLMLYHLNDRYVGRSLDVYGEYSEHEVDLFRRILRPGMIALDIGANIGAFTVPIARAVGPEGRVFAFEPQRPLHLMLCANLSLNGIWNVRALDMGVGRERSVAVAPVIDLGEVNNFGGAPLRADGPGEPVQLAAIDDLGLAACHLIKVDVEGMEREVLSGAAETIARCRPILYVENAYADKSAALIEQIKGCGYRLYRHVPPLFNPGNFFGHDADIFDGIASYNMLCVPRESAGQPTGAKEINGPDDWPLELIGKA